MLFFLNTLFIFRERGRRGERDGERHQSVASHTLPTGDLACNPGMFPDWELNWQPSRLQASAQSTETQQPGLNQVIRKEIASCATQRGAHTVLFLVPT